MKRTVCLEAWPFVHLITGTAVKISNAFGLNLDDTSASWKLSVRSFGPTGNSVA